MNYPLFAALLLATAPAVAQDYQPAYPPPKEPYVVPPAAGQPAAQPFKGANAVLIHTTDSARVALRTLARQLQDQGYTVERIDDDLESFATKPKGFRKLVDYTVSISVTYRNGALLLRGQWHGQLNMQSYDEPAGYTNGAAKLAFAELQAAASAYPHGRVAFAKI